MYPQQSVVTLRDASGVALHCILHRPPIGAPRGDVACLLLSPGVKMRVGPHRLHRKLAAAFLQHGIPVLRVDFAGLGDSEGEIQEERLAQLYRSVQLGRYVETVQAAADWMERNLGQKQFIVGGLCGAAITAVLASQAEPRVAAIYSIGLPVCLDAVEGDGNPVERMTNGQIRDARGVYVRKILQPGSWWRLVTLQSDFRLMRRIVSPVLPRRARYSGNEAALHGVPRPTVPPAPDINPLFPAAFFAAAGRNVPFLLLWGGADRHLLEFREKFLAPWATYVEKFRHVLEEHVIGNANHVLGSPESLAEASRLTGEWAHRVVTRARV